MLGRDPADHEGFTAPSNKQIRCRLAILQTGTNWSLFWSPPPEGEGTASHAFRKWPIIDGSQCTTNFAPIKIGSKPYLSTRIVPHLSGKQEAFLRSASQPTVFSLAVGPDFLYNECKANAAPCSRITPLPLRFL